MKFFFCKNFFCNNFSINLENFHSSNQFSTFSLFFYNASNEVFITKLNELFLIKVPSAGEIIFHIEFFGIARLILLHGGVRA